MGVHDVTSVYHVPLLLERQGLVGFLTRRLQLAKIKIPLSGVERGRSLSERWRGMTRGYAYLYPNGLLELIDQIAKNVYSIKSKWFLLESIPP